MITALQPILGPEKYYGQIKSKSPSFGASPFASVGFGVPARLARDNFQQSQKGLRARIIAYRRGSLLTSFGNGTNQRNRQQYRTVFQFSPDQIIFEGTESRKT